jgi:cell division GTPase FtsZ
MPRFVKNHTSKLGMAFFGGCGCNIARLNIDLLDPDEYKGFSIFAANTDAKSLVLRFGNQEDPKLKRWLDKRAFVDHQLGGDEVTGGIGAGADIEVGKRAFEWRESQEAIIKFFEDKNEIIIGGGLGGGTGTPSLVGAAKLAKKMSLEKGLTPLVVAIMPRPNEGRNNRAAKALEEILKEVPTIVINNSYVTEYIKNKLTPEERARFTVLDAWRAVNEYSFQNVLSIMREIILTTGDATHTDEADLKTIFSYGNHVFVGLAQIKPEEADTIDSEEVVRRLFEGYFQNADIAKCAEVAGLWYHGWAPYERVEQIGGLVRDHVSQHNLRKKHDIEIIEGYRQEVTDGKMWVALIAVAKEVKSSQQIEASKTTEAEVPQSAIETVPVEEPEPSTLMAATRNLLRRDTPLKRIQTKVFIQGKERTIGLKPELAERYNNLKVRGSAATPDEWKSILDAIEWDVKIRPDMPQLELNGAITATH